MTLEAKRSEPTGTDEKLGVEEESKTARGVERKNERRKERKEEQNSRK